MTNIKQWQLWFRANGVVSEEIPTNPNALVLTNLAGSPVFRVVDSVEEQNKLHSLARQKAEEMQRLLVVALPLDHPMTMVQLPGEMMMPKVRVYAGNSASTFNIAGHLIESSFLKELKKEVLNVMSNGVKAKTPLCEWLMKLAGTAWVYGIPSSLPQLDSLLALVSRDVAKIGHLRTRQLSFGRGCGDALLLPIKGVVLKNHSVDQKVEVADLRFISLETEMNQRDASRDRIYSVMTNRFLSLLNDAERGTAADIGASRLGKLTVTETVAENAFRVDTQSVKAQPLSKELA